MTPIDSHLRNADNGMPETTERYTREPALSRNADTGLRELDRILQSLRRDRANFLSYSDHSASEDGHPHLQVEPFRPTQSGTGDSDQTYHEDTMERVLDGIEDIISRNNLDLLDAAAGTRNRSSRRRSADGDNEGDTDGLLSDQNRSRMGMRNLGIFRTFPRITVNITRLMKLVNKSFLNLSVAPCSWILPGVRLSGSQSPIVLSSRSSNYLNQDTNTLEIHIDDADFDTGNISGMILINESILEQDAYSSGSKWYSMEGRIIDFNRNNLFLHKDSPSVNKDAMLWHRLEPFADFTFEEFVESGFNEAVVQDWLDRFVIMRWCVFPGHDKTADSRSTLQDASSKYFLTLNRETGHLAGYLYAEGRFNPEKKLAAWPGKFMTRESYSMR